MYDDTATATRLSLSEAAEEYACVHVAVCEPRLARGGSVGTQGTGPRDRVSRIYKVEARCYNQPLDDWLRSATCSAFFSPALGTSRKRARERGEKEEKDERVITLAVRDTTRANKWSQSEGEREREKRVEDAH